MGKKKIDKLKLIESTTQRNVAFCKRKRGFLKKAIELSSLCGQRILVIIYDEDKKRVVQFSSDDAFQINSAYKAIKLARGPENCNNFEKFNNEDYERLESTDFRSVRYRKNAEYGGDEIELISELEGDHDGGAASNEENDNEESLEQIEPKKLPTKRQKIQKQQNGNESKDLYTLNSQQKKADKSNQQNGSKMDEEIKEEDNRGSQIVLNGSKSPASKHSLVNKVSTIPQELGKQQEQLIADNQVPISSAQPIVLNQEGISENQFMNQVQKSATEIDIGKLDQSKESPSLKDKSKNNIFDADKIKSFGIHNLKREEKSKRKLAANNQTTPPQNLISNHQNYSPSQIIGNLSINVIQELQQTNSQEIQFLLEQHLKQQQMQSTDQQAINKIAKNQQSLQQMIQKQQNNNSNRSVRTSLNNSPQNGFLQLNQQHFGGSKNLHSQGSHQNISPALNKNLMLSHGQHQTARKPVLQHNQGALDPYQIGLAMSQQNQVGQFNNEQLKAIKSPGYNLHQKHYQGQQKGQNFANLQQYLGADTQAVNKSLTAQTQQQLAQLSGHHPSLIQQPSDLLNSLKIPMTHQQQQAMIPGKPPLQNQLKDIENNLNQTIANLIDALGKGKLDTTPQSLERINNTAKVIDSIQPTESMLNYIVNSSNLYGAGGSANQNLSTALHHQSNNQHQQVQQQQQQQHHQQAKQPNTSEGAPAVDLSFLLNDKRAASPAASYGQVNNSLNIEQQLPFLESQIGQIMKNFGMDPQKLNQRPAQPPTAQSSGTPNFQAQDQQRGYATNSSQLAAVQQFQRWNPNNLTQTQQQEASRGQLQVAQPNGQQHPQYLMKQHAATEESVEQRSNFNISPLLMGNRLQKLGGGDVGNSSSNNYLNGLMDHKEEQISQRKLQRQIAQMQSQMNGGKYPSQAYGAANQNDYEGQISGNLAARQAQFDAQTAKQAFDAQRGHNSMQLVVSAAEQDLQKAYNQQKGYMQKPVSQGAIQHGQHPYQGNGGNPLMESLTLSKSPQLIGNKFLNEYQQASSSLSPRPGTNNQK